MGLGGQKYEGVASLSSMQYFDLSLRGSSRGLTFRLPELISPREVFLSKCEVHFHSRNIHLQVVGESPLKQPSICFQFLTGGGHEPPASLELDMQTRLNIGRS